MRVIDKNGNLKTIMSQIQTADVANNAITDALLAQAGAYTFKCNPTNATANEQDATLATIGVADGQFLGNVNSVPTGIPLPVSIFDFRLSLASGTAVPTTDQTSKSTVYLTPYIGNRICLYDGTRWLLRSTSEISIAIGTVVPYQAYDVFCYDNSGTPTLELLEWANATVTMTIASPCVVTWTGHGLSTGASITFTTSGALPTGVSANTQYFVTVVDANTFKLSTTRTTLAAGTFINTSGSQSGTHTGHQPQARQTALTTQDGVLVKTGAATRRYCGTFLADSTTTTQDSLQFRFLWNANNRVVRGLARVESSGGWTYGTLTYRYANANSANRVEVMRGLEIEPVDVRLTQCVEWNGVVCTAIASLGLNSVSAAYAGSAAQGQVNIVSTSLSEDVIAVILGYPGLGYQTFNWIEEANGSILFHGAALAGITGTCFA